MNDMTLSLYHLLDPEVLANPYPLYQRLRSEDPVHWDPYLHAWVVTRYADVQTVFHRFSANRTPTPEQLTALGLSALTPLAQVMVKQMLFLDPPDHGRVRGLASKAFTARRVESLRSHIQDITTSLLDAVQEQGSMDIIADLAYPLPAIVTAEMLGVPTSDWRQLTAWSADFAQVLGNFQHNPNRAARVIKSLEEMADYFRAAIAEQSEHPRDGLIHAYLTAEIDGDHFTEEEVVANTIVTMVGGQETTTNLIGNGVLTLLNNPAELQRLRNDLSLIPSAVEELLRYESPSQHTARLAPEDRELGGKRIQKRQAVIAVMSAANRDPERFPDPDRFDITRQDNRHLAFGYAAHFCFGAPLARVEGQITFEALLRRFSRLQLEPQKLVWRTNLGLRGLTSLKVKFDAAGPKSHSAPAEQGENKAAPEGGQPSTAARKSISQAGIDERHRLLVEWNDTATAYPSDKCVHELVAERAAQTPEAIAVVQGHRQLTFRELNERANQLASCLQQKGVRKDVPVGVCLRRSLELTVALLGVMKAGGACLPLDPEYPRERLAYMLEDSEAPVLLTKPGLLSELGNARPEVVHLDSGWKTLEAYSRENPAETASPESLAYFIYTSGSTGKPRGVLLTHRGLVN